MNRASRAPVVHGDRAAAERLRRDQLEPSRAGQPALVQGRAVAGDPGVDEELVLVDQIQPVQLGRELAATEEHAGRGRVLELLHARAQVAGDVVAVGPREVLSRRRHHVLRLGLQLDRPLAHRRRRLHVAAGDRRPVALHHLVGDAAPQHRPASSMRRVKKACVSSSAIPSWWSTQPSRVTLMLKVKSPMMLHRAVGWNRRCHREGLWHSNQDHRRGLRNDSVRSRHRRWSR
jgi:hypothetical protein